MPQRCFFPPCLNLPIVEMAGPGETEANDVFVEEAPHERGFARVFAAEVAPHLPQLQSRLRNRQSDRIALRRILGLALLAAIWSAYGVWGAGTFDLVAAAMVSGIILDLLLRGRVFHDNDPVREMRALIMTALKHHVEGLDYKPFAGRRVNHDRFVTIQEIPDEQSVATGLFFHGERHDMAFRAIVCTARHAASRIDFHGLLIEIDTGVALDGSVLILRRGQSAWIEPDMQEIAIPGHPAFRALFTAHCENTDAPRSFLTDQAMTALTRLPEQTGDGLVSVLAVKGQLLLEVALPSCTNDHTRTLKAVAEARDLLKTVMLPYRIIDTLHGVDPDTGGRYRPH